jgi:VWFA-related protein
VRPPIPLSLLLLFTLPIAAQQPDFRGTVEVRLIEVDVVVTDREGNRVYGLSAEDFEVYEGRKRKEISNFSEYRSPHSAGVAPIPASAPASQAREPRSILVLIDWLPREGFVRSRAFDQIETLLRKIAAGGDRVAIGYWNPGLARVETVAEPSSDIAGVIRAVRALGGNVTVGTPSLPSVQETNAVFEQAIRDQNARGITPLVSMAEEDRFTKFVTAEIELMKIRRKASALQRLMTSFGAGKDKKAVLYVSHDFGMPLEPGARLAAVGVVDDLARAANAAGVTFYAVRPVIPDTEFGAGESQPSAASPVEELERQTDGLRRLAVATGGLIEIGPASVGSLGNRMADDLDSYYSLAYHASSDGSDRERRITVRAKNPLYRVRTRQSFVEKSNDTLARDAVMAHLFGGDEASDLRFAIEEGKPERSGANRWLVPIVVRIPTGQLQFAAEGRERVALVKVLIVAANGLVEVTKMNESDLRIIEGKHTARGFIDYSVKVLVDRRGSELSIGVMDRRSGAVGVRTIDNRGRFR